MPKFVVDGGVSLNGEIRPAGNKNAALPMIAAALLTEEPIVYDNVPEIRDVKTLLDLMGTLGVQSEWIGPNRLRVQAADVSASDSSSGTGPPNASPSVR